MRVRLYMGTEVWIDGWKSEIVIIGIGGGFIICFIFFYFFRLSATN